MPSKRDTLPDVSDDLLPHEDEQSSTTRSRDARADIQRT